MRDLVPRLYRPVRPVAERLGVHPFLLKMYSRLKKPIYRIKCWKNSGFVEISINGIDCVFFIDDADGYKWIANYGMEKDIINRILRSLSSGDIYWDVGANIGLHTIFPAKKVNSGTVLAFEPHPSNSSRLKKNIDINDLDNIDVMDVALSDADSSMELKLEDPDPGAGGNTLKSENRSGGLFQDSDTISVNCISGDGLIDAGHKIPETIKIDVEGAEMEVIKGMEGILSNDKCTNVFCEVHRHYSVSKEEYQNRMKQFGFDSEVINETKIQTFFYSHK